MRAGFTRWSIGPCSGASATSRWGCKEHPELIWRAEVQGRARTHWSCSVEQEALVQERLICLLCIARRRMSLGMHVAHLAWIVVVGKRSRTRLWNFRLLVWKLPQCLMIRAGELLTFLWGFMGRMRAQPGGDGCSPEVRIPLGVVAGPRAELALFGILSRNLQSILFQFEVIRALTAERNIV